MDSSWKGANMTRKNDDYFNWLISLVCDKQYDSKYYSKLLYHLYNIPFEWDLPMDENRYYDGLHLKDSFSHYINRDWCSILEMMIALSLRIEREYMDDGSANPIFWGMIKSLGLYFNDDYNYDEAETEMRIERFLSRSYDANGSGGLFTLNDAPYDVPDMQIWEQAMRYVSELTYEDDWLN